MLYATTRSNSHVETTHRAIHMDRCSDGGFFVPFRLPELELGQILQMKDHTFGENMASVMNLFFSCNLTGVDVDFLIGRSPAKITSIPHKILIAEAWHCGESRLDYIVRRLFHRISTGEGNLQPTNWVQIAVRIAVIFASYGMLLASGQANVRIPLDIAMATGDFSGIMAAWYARKMGLPLGNIVCGCNANGMVWDLLHRGIMSTNSVCVNTNTPLADIVIPDNLERLVDRGLGKAAVRSYLDKRCTGQLYTLHQQDAEQLRSGMFASVISDSRVNQVIHSVFRTNSYILSPYDALAYASLLDYRATTGESRPAMIFSQRSPTCDCEMVAKNLRVRVDEVLRRVSMGD